MFLEIEKYLCSFAVAYEFFYINIGSMRLEG